MTTITTGTFRVGRTAELRQTSGGDSIIDLSLATNYGKKGDDGKRPTQWIEGKLWGAMAENLAKYLIKGQEVFAAIEDMHTEEFAKRDGGLGYKLTGRVSAINIVGVWLFDQQEGQQEQRQEPPQRATASAPAPTPQRAAAQSPRGGSGFDDMSDDIPF